MAIEEFNRRDFESAVAFLFHAGWCPREELARVVVTRLSEDNTKGARDFLQHDCGISEIDLEGTSLDELLDLAKGWLCGKPW